MTGLTAYELQELADDPELCAAIEPGADDSPWNCVATDIICTSSAPDLAAKGKDCPGIMSSSSSSSSVSRGILCDPLQAPIPTEEVQRAIHECEQLLLHALYGRRDEAEKIVRE